METTNWMTISVQMAAKMDTKLYSARFWERPMFVFSKSTISVVVSLNEVVTDPVISAARLTRSQMQIHDKTQRITTVLT